jgi:hypothetical protein
MSEIRLVCGGLSQSAYVWTVAGVIGVPAITKITIVCMALRGAAPEHRPKIISALAEMFRWWRRFGRQGLYGRTSVAG